MHFPRVTYQNKIFDLTLLTFIMAVLGSIELKKKLELRNFFLSSMDPRTAMIKVRQCQIKYFVLMGHPTLSTLYKSNFNVFSDDINLILVLQDINQSYQAGDECSKS